MIKEDDMSQKDKILRFLKRGHSISPYEAIAVFNCFRLAARINELRNEGHNVVTVMEDAHGKRWAEYHLKIGE